MKGQQKQPGERFPWTLFYFHVNQGRYSRWGKESLIEEIREGEVLP